MSRFAAWVAKEIKTIRDAEPQDRDVTQEAAQAVLDRPSAAQGPTQPTAAPQVMPDYKGMAKELAGLIAAQEPGRGALQSPNMDTRLAGLLERADKRQGPWDVTGSVSMERLAARVTSLPGLRGEDRVLAEVIDRTLSGGGMKPAPDSSRSQETPVEPENIKAPAVEPSTSTYHTPPGQGSEVDKPDGKPKSEERVEEVLAQMNLPLPPVPSRDKVVKQPELSSGKEAAAPVGHPRSGTSEVEIAGQAARTSPMPEMAGPPDYKGLGLQVAVAMAQRLDVDDPIHAHDDMPLFIPIALRGYADKTPDAPQGGEALVRAWAEEPDHPRFAKIVAEATRRALAEGPLPPAATIRAQRKAFIDRVIWNKKVAQSDAEVAGYLDSFIHGELVAMASPTADWPQSLPTIPEETREDMARDFAIFANIRKERIMDDMMKKNPDEAREFIIKELAIGHAPDNVMAQVSRQFTLAELVALQDPKTVLPDTLPDLPQATRVIIAETLSKAVKSKMEGAGDNSASQAPKRQVRIEKAYAGRALQLACAASERVEAGHPVHSMLLQAEISILLKQADEAQDLPWEKVNDLARSIAKERVLTDLRVRLASAIRFSLYIEDTARFTGTPIFPLMEEEAEFKEQYRKAQKLPEYQAPKPQRIDELVACALVMPDVNGSLADALQTALEFGSPRGLDDLQKERRTLVATLAGDITGQDDLERKRVIRRLYRAFTQKELNAIERPGNKLPWDLRQLRDIDRSKLSANFRTTVAKKFHNPTPWKERHHALGRSIAPQRFRTPGRGRGMGMV